MQGEMLREARERRGITKEAVGGHIHRSAETVSRWETNKSRPPRSVVVVLAHFLGEPRLLEDAE